MVRACESCKFGGDLALLSSYYEEGIVANRNSTDAALDVANYLGLEVDILADQVPSANPRLQTLIDEGRAILTEISTEYSTYFHRIANLLANALVTADQMDCSQRQLDVCPRLEALFATETDFEKLTENLMRAREKAGPARLDRMDT